MISICTALGHRWQGVTVCLLMLVLLGATAVHAQDRPMLTVPTVSVGNISSTEATVTWVAHDVAGCAATRYLVRVAGVTGASVPADPVYVAASEPFRVTFRHLTPNTPYRTAVDIYQSTCGQQAWTPSMTSFTTLRAAPTDTPVPMDTDTPVPPTHTPRPTDRPTLTVPTVSVGPISSTEATVTWVAHDVAGCAATRYLVRVAGVTGASVPADPVYVAASEPLRVTFRHLTPNTPYRTAVDIYQSTCGQQAWTPSMTYFTTLRAAPTATPVPMDTHTPVPPTHTPRPTDRPTLTVPTVSVGPIGSTEATVTWVAHDVAGCAATRYLVRVAGVTGASVPADPVYVAASEPLRVTFRHLTPNTPYRTAVDIYQSTCGQQAWTPSMTSFTTLRAAPTATPVPMDTHTPVPPTHTPRPTDRPMLTVPTVSVGPISSTEATVTWVAHDVAGCAATRYLVRVAGVTGASVPADPVYVAASEPFRVTFRHLTPNTPYRTAVDIYQSTCGQQAWTPSMTSFTTLRAAPTATPVPMDTYTPVPPTHTPRPTDTPRLTVPTARVGPISSTEATVTWMANDVAGCAATQYIVYIVHASGSYASDPVYVAASEPLRVTFRHLTPTHQYYVAVGITQSTCGQQAGARSATYFTTLRATPVPPTHTPRPTDTHTPVPPTHTPVPPANTPVTIPAIGAPHPPKNVTVVVGSTEARVTWVPPDDPGKCAPISYRISGSGDMDDRDTPRFLVYQEFSVAHRSFTIRNLKPSTNYYLDVFAVDSCDAHSIKREVDFTTLHGSVVVPPATIQAPPHPPKNVTVVAGSTAARVTWVAGDPGDCALFSHHLEIRKFTSTFTYESVVSREVSAAHRSYTIRNLKPATYYMLYVRAINQCDESSILTRVRLITLAGAVALPTPAPPDTPTPVPHEQPG